MRFNYSKLLAGIAIVLMLLATLTPAMASVPAYSNLNNVNIPEQTVTVIDSDFSIANSDGTGFGSGYIEFNLSDSNSNDDLGIQSSGSPNSNGAISISGTDVYVGTGSSNVKIGTVNATYDGQEGEKLRIDLITESGSVPTNNDFETGDLTGWTIDNSVSSVPDTSEIKAAMYETATGGGYDLDNTADSITQSTSIDGADVNQGTSSLLLSVSGSCNQPYGYVWGPSATSSSFSASAGDRILFDWKATKTGDWYVAYALLIDNENIVNTVLLAEQGTTTDWTTKEVLIPQSSNNLQFKFILGCYDNTGGLGVGSTMHIDNIRAMLVTDNVVSSLAQAITHNYTNDSPSGAVVAGRTLTITAEDGDGETSSTTTTLSVYGDAPLFNSGTSFSLSENETNQTLVIYDTQADNGDGGSNDQKITYSISGGDAQLLFDIDSDDGEVRLNGVGVSTLDYETKSSYSLDIQADDGQAVNGGTSQTISITVTDVNSTLSLGNVADITCDWGQEFTLNHSISSFSDTANGVNVNYNVSWIEAGILGVVAVDDIEWHNQTLTNSTVQEILVALNGTSTDSSAINDSDVFLLNITKRDIKLTSDPESSQTLDQGDIFWINGSANGEYSETFIGDAVLTRNGVVVGSSQTVIDGNASFNTSLSTSGNYNFAIRFYNTSYYYNESTNNSVVTINELPTSRDSGNRVSNNVGQPPENVESTDTSIKYVMGGTKVEYELSNGDDPILGISFDSKDNEGLVVAKVQVLKDNPDGVTTPPANSYETMSINLGSEGTISEHNAENILIKFKVSWEWINNNDIDPATIRMTRFNDGNWQDLPSDKIDDDGDFLYFTAQTPGFSLFSVIGDEKGTISSEGEQESVSHFEDDSVAEETNVETKNTPGFEMILAIAGIAGAMLVVNRRRN